MFQVTEYYRGKKYVHELHSLTLPSGQLAHKLTQPDLLAELKALGLEVDAYMGNQQLLTAFSRYLADTKPPETTTKSWEATS
jgi:hypothetical protein